MDSRLLDEDKIMQICFVTDNLERSVEWFADLTGKPPSHVARAAEPDVAKAIYRDRRAAVSCRLVLFEFGNIDVEFLEPGPEPSVWREFIDEKGPGCHHIALKTRNLSKRSEYLGSKGHAMLPRGEFEKGGGRYAYFDSKRELGVFLELLEFDSDREEQP